MFQMDRSLSFYLVILVSVPYDFDLEASSLQALRRLTEAEPTESRDGVALNILPLDSCLLL